MMTERFWVTYPFKIMPFLVKIRPDVVVLVDRMLAFFRFWTQPSCNSNQTHPNQLIKVFRIEIDVCLS